jgi:tRNA pseudouridine32 synthase / 23S rRNA pseudouridine746 synthase
VSRARPTWRPPHRHGVGASCVSLPPGEWPSVLAFLSERLPTVSEADWRCRMARGDVLDPTGHPLPPDTAYRPMARLWYWREPPDEPVIPFEAAVLYRDERLLVVDKPHFLPMAPTGRYARETLLARLQRQWGLDDLVPLHRLDRETAGVVMFCLRVQDRAAYQNLFRDRQVDKTYEALAPWAAGFEQPVQRHSRLQRSASHFMQTVEVPGPPNALSHIQLIRRLGEHGLWGHYRLTPLTGHKHQLRVHMNALGLPLLGDRIYPQWLDQASDQPGQAGCYDQPLRLLARQIAFTDPFSGEARCFTSQRSLDLPD